MQILGSGSTGRRHDVISSEKLDATNVAYQGRVLVSFLTLLPVCIWNLNKTKTILISEEAKTKLTKWLNGLMDRAGLIKNDVFIAKEDFKKKGYLGSGGIGRFRDTLWAAAIGTKDIHKMFPEKVNKLAEKHKALIYSKLGKS